MNLLEQRPFAELITKIILVDDSNLPTYIVSFFFSFNLKIKRSKNKKY